MRNFGLPKFFFEGNFASWFFFAFYRASWFFFFFCIFSGLLIFFAFFRAYWIFLHFFGLPHFFRGLFRLPDFFSRAILLPDFFCIFTGFLIFFRGLFRLPDIFSRAFLLPDFFCIFLASWFFFLHFFGLPNFFRGLFRLPDFFPGVFRLSDSFFGNFRASWISPQIFLSFQIFFIQDLTYDIIPSGTWWPGGFGEFWNSPLLNFGFELNNAAILNFRWGGLRVTLFFIFRKIFMFVNMFYNNVLHSFHHFSGRGTFYYYALMMHYEFSTHSNLTVEQLSQVTFHSIFGTHKEDLSILSQLTATKNWFCRSEFGSKFRNHQLER